MDEGKRGVGGKGCCGRILQRGRTAPLHLKKRGGILEKKGYGMSVITPCQVDALTDKKYIAGFSPCWSSLFNFHRMRVLA